MIIRKILMTFRKIDNTKIESYARTEEMIKWSQFQNQNEKIKPRNYLKLSEEFNHPKMGL